MRPLVKVIAATAVIAAARWDTFMMASPELRGHRRVANGGLCQRL